MYQEINNYIRGIKEFLDFHINDQKKLKLYNSIRALTLKELPKPIRVYRGVDFNYPTNLKKINLKGFSSTSLEKDIALRFVKGLNPTLLIINRVVQGIDMSLDYRLNNVEKEVILPDDTEILITFDKYETQYRVIEGTFIKKLNLFPTFNTNMYPKKPILKDVPVLEKRRSFFDSHCDSDDSYFDNNEPIEKKKSKLFSDFDDRLADFEDFIDKI
ncbi:hypothetical protein FRA_25c01410 [Francisella sp. W12-1067]|nr:hypothetical protein FRA_25c01410 [Francisella sp. W12-1067]